jgi:hypothetical protein
MEALLDELAAVEAGERGEADRLRDAPGLPRVERVLEEVWGTSARASGRRWVGPILFAAVAAAVIGFFFVRGRIETDTHTAGPTGEYLGEGELRIVTPAESVAAWPAEIAWEGPKGSSFTLEVRALDTADKLVGPVRTIETRYPLDPAETRTWPDTIRIEISTMGPDGEPLPPAIRIARLKK